MEPRGLDALISEYRDEILGPGTQENAELARFREFLLRHGGLKKLEIAGRKAQLLESAEALRCFHFSQYLDWYLTEKVGASRRELEEARAALGYFDTLPEERVTLLEGEAIAAEVHRFDAIVDPIPVLVPNVGSRARERSNA